MKEIPLTRGMVAFVDDEDFEDLIRFKWCAYPEYNTWYAMHQRSVGEKGKKRQVPEKMHHRILAPKKGLYIDHIDGNGLNNQKSNLRLVTARENAQNVHIPKSSIYPGVHWDKKNKKWAAQIKINKKAFNLGRYRTETEAFDAYCLKLKEIGGFLHERFVAAC